MQSHFDNIDLPTGIEASIPQFSSSRTRRALCGFSSKKVHAEPANGSKTSAGSGLQVQKCAMKDQVKELVKIRHHKGSSGLAGSSSDKRHEQLVGESDHGQIIDLADETAVQDSGNDDEVPRKYKNFKKFDMVEDYSDHHYAESSSAMEASLIWLLPLIHLSVILITLMQIAAT